VVDVERLYKRRAMRGAEDEVRKTASKLVSKLGHGRKVSKERERGTYSWRAPKVHARISNVHNIHNYVLIRSRNTHPTTQHLLGRPKKAKIECGDHQNGDPGP
jgi:hypothetical protein